MSQEKLSKSNKNIWNLSILCTQWYHWKNLRNVGSKKCYCAEIFLWTNIRIKSVYFNGMKLLAFPCLSKHEKKSFSKENLRTSKHLHFISSIHLNYFHDWFYKMLIYCYIHVRNSDRSRFIAYSVYILTGWSVYLRRNHDTFSNMWCSSAKNCKWYQ